MKKFVRELQEFAVGGNVLDLAVAVVLGAAFGAVVNSLVKDVIMPFIAAIGGQPSFDDLTIHVGDGRVRYGAFINNVITFVIVAFVLFLIVRSFLTIKNRRKREEAVAEEAAPAEEILLLREIRDELRNGART